MTSERAQLLEWDTAFWGVRAARVSVAQPQEFDEADGECARLGVRWASLLVPVEGTALLNAAVRRGFDVVDVRHTLARRMGPTDRRPDPGPQVASPDDADQLVEIARRAYVQSRFFADPHLDDTRCDEFYETWVRNSLGGPMADDVVVVRRPGPDQGGRGRIDGFITVRAGPDGVGSMPLVAVRAECRGHGVGQRLLASTLDWMAAHGVATVEVVTQLSNRAAVRLYEAAGFRTVDTGVWLHRWYGERP